MSSSAERPQRRLTTLELIAMKERGERIAVLTAYDFLMAGLVDDAGVDCVLVGDSLGQVVAGEDSTLPVTLEQMIYHARAVGRALKRALLVVDMPFLTYQISAEEAIRNCGRVLQASGAQAVKLEGGHEDVASTIRRVVDAGIPVMGHLGLTPQSVHRLGGYRLVGRRKEESERLRADARRLEEAGCFSIVLEMLPKGLAGEVTREVSVPTIGIGAGPDCDGQVLVLPDMLGLNEGFSPGFLKRYADLAATVREAVGEYVREVKDGEYPGPEHSYE
ncbi:MAG: 3-methyl-2-oxobutanoate hydroxymethyltransferase [Gemmatimonadetes bacterium]|uniref:3-methyl-2-oxobutanoate hydroxymethyltransferase n=1 Tax=Candidatus Kutchimonas denitrificans TaxID=3056748 RepID=A0AAE5CCT0_9BACT|nr:3-methyl-2-oxobutanoate hydroxymethyltransferase [Gemmatimonadota bacterium]NIR74609.1 3-methyl-2-oxobutanoate hydroxymethyltransferase [Candidatus Kutchimonas denitrificans]NIS02799.1 3-methyl-2-oxobutanoate hydroxymethyltransferase [Gemmatimonadota bacterium]NIT68960.1 3-methyl-2-oxobutanoate hydroxymethyltransferase [Gemmatimonadota bacterium]NIU52265.1 3-methyl-2-oxobutanoate hydroxymethyltransferase [Gemmatimonadota bacterium]